ncbi:MAG: hydroxyisourate hydrolase [Gemmatimonadaceae bacterium]
MSATTTISTHVLDTSLGAPAAGIAVTLHARNGSKELGRGTTNADGRVTSFGDVAIAAGSYRLCYDVAPYFASSRRASFYAEICIAFEVAAEAQHYHVPLLLAPFGYSTYRGS